MTHIHSRGEEDYGERSFTPRRFVLSRGSTRASATRRESGPIRHSPAIVLSLFPYFCRTWQKAEVRRSEKGTDMTESHICILVVRKILAGDRSRLVGPCYPGDEPGHLQLAGKAGCIRHSLGSLLSLNRLVNCFFRCAARTSGTNIWPGMICGEESGISLTVRLGSLLVVLLRRWFKPELAIDGLGFLALQKGQPLHCRVRMRGLLHHAARIDGGCVHPIGNRNAHHRTANLLLKANL